MSGAVRTVPSQIQTFSTFPPRHHPSADAAGYSRLLKVDERGTIVRQKAHRAERIDPAIAEQNGRIVKTTGDGLPIKLNKT